MSVPTIKFRQEDNDQNGKVDVFNLKITFRGDPSKVRQVQLISTYDYYVETKLKMQIVGMLDLTIDTPNGASNIIADGSIVLTQSKPVLIDRKVRTLFNFDPLLAADYAQHSIEKIRKDYHARSERVNFVGSTFVQPLGSSYSTSIDLKLTVPRSQEIVYRPGVMETLKFAWMQYLMLLIPCLIVAWTFLSYLFKSKILHSLVVSDLKPRKKLI